MFLLPLAPDDVFSIWSDLQFFTWIRLSAAALQLSWTRLVGSLRTYLGSSYLAPEMLTALVNNLNTFQRVKTKTNQMKNRTSFIIAESQVSIWNNYTRTFHNCLPKGYLRLCCNAKGIPNFCTRLKWLVQGLHMEQLKALCIQAGKGSFGRLTI